MILKGFRKERFPFYINSHEITAVDVYGRDEHYWDGDKCLRDQYVREIVVATAGRAVCISRDESLIINGVPVVNDSEEHAIQILEFLGSLMWLEHKEPEEKPKYTVDEMIEMDRKGTWPQRKISK